MADFRKLFPVLAVGAFMLASVANAQVVPVFSCSANGGVGGVPPLVRAEGLAELVGDVVLQCSGGTSTAGATTTTVGGVTTTTPAQPVPQVNIQIFLNTNITSRLVADPLSEALLLIDEPAPGAQNPCTASTGTCGFTGTFVSGVTPGVNYQNGSVPNVYQGRQTGPNTLVWLGVPIDPPGTTATRIIRITNVRANANQLGVSSTLIPTQIVMFISATGTTSILINQPQQTVAFITPGLTGLAANGRNGLTLLQCSNFNSGLSTDNTRQLQSGFSSILRWREGFASAFKRRTVTKPSSNDSAGTPGAQNIPGAIYNTETGFYNPSFSTNGLGAAGLADSGTRLIARFNNVPAGVQLYVTAYGINTTDSNDNVIANYNASGTTLATANGGTSVPAPVIRAVTADSNGAGSFSAATIASNLAAVGSNTVATGTNNNIVALVPVSLSNGSGSATWEILDSDPLSIETAKVAVFLAYTANTSANLPGLGTPTVNLNYAPISTVSVASSSAPLPRFADSSTSRNLGAINSCTTNILFPFLSNQLGFDSGVAISNTSVDPFGTAPQAGTCKLNYYGGTTGGGAAPAAQTSQVVTAGSLLVFTLSSGGSLGIAATPGFQGYMIAQCGFQYAHGFAFISDVGAQKISEAYLALTMDGATGSRTGFVSESLGH